MYFPSGITGTGGGSGTGQTGTLQTCRVTPTSGTRTLVLGSRPWFGHNKPVTVLYKMVGGGAGAGDRPQLESAGGSTVILKNGAVVAVAPGMNAGGTRSPINGSFTVTSADTLTFILGVVAVAVRTAPTRTRARPARTTGMAAHTAGTPGRRMETEWAGAAGPASTAAVLAVTR